MLEILTVTNDAYLIVTVEKMRNFTYGSRVIENEQQVRLQTNVRKIGNLLRAVVNFCLTFFLFVIINFLLRNLVQHTNFTFVTVLRFVQESAEMLLSNSALSVITFVYEHFFCLMLAVAFTCVYQFGFVLNGNTGRSVANFANEHKSFGRNSRENSTQIDCSTVSYRHKVCFLS